jgi:beta-phosphoglucomutase
MLPLSVMNTGFIFDMNGTMIDDMGYHETIWHRILNDELHANISTDALKLQMYGKNEELLERIFGKGRFTADELNKIAMEKEDAYQELYKPNLKLITGLDQFLSRAKTGSIKMSIGTAAIPYNVDFIMDNLNLHNYFTTIITAGQVADSKPHPETFLKCAYGMQVKPGNCIVFEDSPKGIEAALNAGMKAVAITTMHHVNDFDSYNNILFCIQDYTDVRLNDLFLINNMA